MESMLHVMNRKRKFVVVVYFVAMAGASVYVPWTTHGPYGNEMSYGYHWINKETMRESLSPGPRNLNPNQLAVPGHRSLCEKFPKTQGCGSEYLPQVPKYRTTNFYAAIDYGRLAIEYIAITAIFMALFLALPNRPRKRDSAGPNP